MNLNKPGTIGPPKFSRLVICLMISAQISGRAADTSIEIAREGGGAKIVFSGNLFSAVTLNGPWEIVTNAVSAHKTELAGAQKFFLVAEPLTNDIFSSRSVVALTLTGQFQAFFDLAFAGTPDGIFPPKREKPYFDGTLSMPGLMLPISLRVRGNSSLQECPFPKMKFKVSKENRPGTPFAVAREIKIGTHCADGGRGTIGRLRDQIAAFREALAYETLELLDFTAPKVRRASILYRDTTAPTNGTEVVGWQVVREGMVLDDIEVVAGRLNGRALDETQLASYPNLPLMRN